MAQSATPSAGTTKLCTPPPPVLHKDVIPNHLHMLVVQGCDSKGVLDVDFRSNQAWALYLDKKFECRDLAKLPRGELFISRNGCDPDCRFKRSRKGGECEISVR